MKYLYAISALAGLTLATPAIANLEDTYRQQQAAKAKENDCRHWYQAQWKDRIQDDSKRIRQFPNGRLWEVELFINEKGAVECRSYPSITFTAGFSRMGYFKHIYKDGSGSESTVKAEGQDLVSYYSTCWDWVCSRRNVSRYVLGSRLTPEFKTKQLAAIEEAKAKQQRCLTPKPNDLGLPPPLCFGERLRVRD